MLLRKVSESPEALAVFVRALLLSISCIVDGTLQPATVDQVLAICHVATSIHCASLLNT